LKADHLPLILLFELDLKGENLALELAEPLLRNHRLA
jgi:hypothetical protein